MKLVEFDNGTYGIRLFWFFGWCYLDLHGWNFDIWWQMRDKNFTRCQGTYENVKNIFRRYENKKAVTHSRKRKVRAKVIPRSIWDNSNE